MPKRHEDRISYADDLSVDDATVLDVEMFRLERMAPGVYWIKLHVSGGPATVFWLNSSKPIRVNHETETN